MFELLKQIKQSPITMENPEEVACPFCGSDNFHSFGVTSTLVGFVGKDMNHKWRKRRCNNCQKEYTVESKGDNVWVTQKRNGECFLIKGVPSCFEKYVYDCKCGGKIRRRYTQLDGISDTGGLLTTKVNTDGSRSLKQYRIFWECDTCSYSIESQEDYYKP